MEGQLDLMDIMNIAKEQHCSIQITVLPGDVEADARFKITCSRDNMNIRTVVSLEEVLFSKTFLLEHVIRNNCNALQAVSIAEGRGR